MSAPDEVLHAGGGGLLVHFACPNPECLYVLEEVVYDAVYDIRVERLDDGIDFAQTKVKCRDCSSEYEVVVLAKPDGKEVTLKDHPDTRIDFADWDVTEEYDDFLAEYTPEDPYGVYTSTVRELDNLQHGSAIMESAVPAFNKMVCLQHIIAIEAYLSDRLIKIVTNDRGKLLALVGATPALRDKTPKLIDIAKETDYVLKAAKDYLQRFSFHDLASVAKFFKAVLKIDIFEDEAHEKEMLDIIIMRHDLVHRSGRDNDGKDVAIQDDDITILKDLMQALVARVETAYNAYVVERHFDKLD